MKRSPLPPPAGRPPPPGSPSELRIGPKIKRVPHKKAILKYGHTVKSTEAEAIRFIARRTSIPVPYVYEYYERDEQGHILMSEIEGKPLDNVWQHLSTTARDKIIIQLREYVTQLQSIRGEYYGALGPSPSEDIFFKHLPFIDSEQLYGPYHTAPQYIAGLQRALQNSRPGSEASVDDEKLGESICQAIGTDCVFSHGDLHPFNILVNEDGNITGIVDWESAGFSFLQREYVEVKLRAWPGTYWDTILDTVFPSSFKECLPLFEDLERRLVQYTGF